MICKTMSGCDASCKASMEICQCHTGRRSQFSATCSLSCLSGLPSGRWGHSLTAVNDGRALLFGGQGDGLELCKDACWLFSKARNTWDELTTGVPASRMGHAAAYNPVRKLTSRLACLVHVSFLLLCVVYWTDVQATLGGRRMEENEHRKQEEKTEREKRRRDERTRAFRLSGDESHAHFTLSCKRRRALSLLQVGRSTRDSFGMCSTLTQSRTRGNSSRYVVLLSHS